MAEILKRRRLVNPGRRRRRMTAKQIRFFGTKRQRAALRHTRKRRNYGTRRGRAFSRWGIKHHIRGHNPHRRRRNRRRKNIGEILTVHVNPGRRKGMAKQRRRTRRHVVHHRRHHQRRSNPVYVMHRRRRRHNSVYNRRRRNRRHYSRRRNPFGGSFFSGVFGKAVGVVGGYALTKIIAAQLPAQFTQGVLGYVGIGVVAFAQGKIVGKVAKNSAVGNDMVVGGITYLVGKIMSDYFPSFNLGLSGMGMIAPSSFYTPQVPLPGVMGNFVVPSAVPVAAGMHGVGRLSARRGGRLQ